MNSNGILDNPRLTLGEGPYLFSPAIGQVPEPSYSLALPCPSSLISRFFRDVPLSRESHAWGQFGLWEPKQRGMWLQDLPKHKQLSSHTRFNCPELNFRGVQALRTLDCLRVFG